MTGTEKLILELKEAVAILVTRADSSEAAIGRIEIEDVRDRLARIETRLNYIEQAGHERRRSVVLMLSALISAVVGALAGAIATYFVQQTSS